MLSVSPDSIKAITDKLVITPANENLVLPEFRKSKISNSRDTWLTPKIERDIIGNIDEFYFEAFLLFNNFTRPLPHNINFIIEVKSKKDGFRWYTAKLLGKGEVPEKIWLYTAVLKNQEQFLDIEYYRLGIQQEAGNNFVALDIKFPKIYKKKSAYLIVDGTIEGKHIKSSTIETGHLKAGSVTAKIIASDAIESKHMKVDDAMIDKIVGNKAFVSKLWAKEAFINNLNAIKISAEDLTGKVISSPQILGGTISSSTQFVLGKNSFMVPINSGLQIFTESSNELNSGVVFQMHGYERIVGSNETIPRGMYIFNEKNFNARGSNTFQTHETLLTVDGMVKIRGFTRGNDYGFEGAAIPTLAYPLVGGNSSIGSSSYAAICRLSFETILGGKDYLVVETPTNTYRVPTASKSDIRLKENVKETKVKAIKYIEKIKFKSFDWKDKSLGKEKLGVIAQDLEKI